MASRSSGAIYVPKGRALEYAPLACNPYDGCSHQCAYCYVPAMLHCTREAWAAKVPAPRPHILERLRADALRLKGDKRPVFLCFTSDPYQPLEKGYRLTREIIKILHAAGLKPRILTKNPALAVNRDLELLRESGAELGATFVFTKRTERQKWEPNAPPFGDRLSPLIRAREAGVRSWASLEPVIDPAQSLDILRTLAEEKAVDYVRVGKLNHFPDLEKGIDWALFGHTVCCTCTDLGLPRQIKHDLWVEMQKGGPRMGWARNTIPGEEKKDDKQK